MAGSPVSSQWRVPRADWDTPPWNRWSFQHVCEILPTSEVSRGNGPVIPLSSDLQDIGEIEFESLNTGQMTIASMLDETYTDGFIVIKSDKVIHESYFNTMTPQSLHLAQSVSKSVVATVAGILIGQGLLDPHAPIIDCLPELEKTAWKGAKLQHVLDMTSGVRFNEEYTDRNCDIGKTDVASGWRPLPFGAGPGDDWPSCVWDQILSLNVQEAPHGSRFQYRSIETDVLAHAMERVSGRTLTQLLSDELWSKIGAEENACITVDSAGYALAEGGYCASLRDFARVGLLHLNNGICGGQQILPKTWIEDIRSGDHGLFNDTERATWPNGLYRNQFWIEDAREETVMAIGVFGQFIYISPKDDMVVVKLSSWPDFIDSTHSINTTRAIHAIAGALS
jgi:CubicO group peptidase (beta-lactamase class C family)